MNLLFRIFLLVTIWFYSCKQSQESICLIPRGYIGPIAIIYDIKDGLPEKVDSGLHLYTIPQSGVLETQVKFNSTILKNEYFYIDVKGNKTKLPYALPHGWGDVGVTYDKVTDSEIICTGEEATQIVYKDGQKKNCRLFIVCRKKDIDSLAFERDKLSFKLSGFDIWKKK